MDGAKLILVHNEAQNFSKSYLSFDNLKKFIFFRYINTKIHRIINLYTKRRPAL